MTLSTTKYFNKEELVCIKEEMESELVMMFDSPPGHLYGMDEENAEDLWYKDVKLYKSIIKKATEGLEDVS